MIWGQCLEMNIHLPQSIQTKIELEEVADVKWQIITPSRSTTIIGLKQDGLLGAYNLTSPHIRIDWKNAMNIISYTSIDDFSALKKDKIYTGHELFSLIVPSRINLNKGGIEIKNGKLIKGYLGKDTLGDGRKNAIHQLVWDEYDADETLGFLNNSLRLINNFNLDNGFTIGIGDMELTNSVAEQIGNIMSTMDNKVNFMITEIENKPNMMTHKVFEDRLFAEVNNIREDVAKLLINNIPLTNNMIIMKNSGSKGAPTNCAKMVGCVGLQAFEGKLFPKKINNRTLPFFFQNDDRPDSRGMIRNPFLHGVSFSNFFFLNVAGRQGMIDGAVKTSESGYIQRKLIKTMEDAMIKYDGTVRTGTNSLLQLVYGDTCANTTKQYEYTIGLIEMSDSQIRDKYSLKESDLSAKENKEYINRLFEMRDILRTNQIKNEMSVKTLASNYMLPVNFVRIVENMKNDEVNKKVSGELTATYIIKKLNDMLHNTETCVIPIGSKPSTIKHIDEQVIKTSFKVALHDILNPARCLYEYKLNKAMFDNGITQLVNNFNKNLIEPGDMVGIICAQALGEPASQMTLNSVDWEDKILVLDKKTNTSLVTEIGKYIDDLVTDKNTQRLGDNKDTEMGDTYYLDTKERALYIQSVDEDGKVSWRQIEAVTKHLPMNKDGTNTLLKVTTRSGRDVTVTKAKSLLTRKNDKIVAIRGDEVKVGMHLPLMIQSPETKYNDYLDMSPYFPKNEYIYTSEVEKARKRKAENNKKGIRQWFKDYNGKEFTTPYARQDSLKHVLDGGNNFVLEEGCIYSRIHGSKGSNPKFPEKMKLDKDFGFFIGAFIAEGCTSETYVAISNNDDGYLKRIGLFCDKYNIGYHRAVKKRDNPNWQDGHSVRIHSTMLTKFIKETCGVLAPNKKIPDFAYTANNEFVAGLIDGYFSGDGTVSAKEFISATTVSETLIYGLGNLLSRYGIFSSIGKPTRVTSNNMGTKPENIHQTYTISIRNNNIIRFHKNIKLEAKEKETKISNLSKKIFKYNNGVYDVIPGCTLDVKHKMRSTICGVNNKGIVHREDLRKMDIKGLSKDKLTLLNSAINNDVYFDEIVAIEEVPPTHKYVYDMTVEGTLNFNIFNQLCVKDSFHSSGIASISTTTQGVPRVKELMSLSKKIKTPQMVITLSKEYQNSREMAKKIASYMKYTTLKDIKKATQCYYDPLPNEKGSIMEKDNVTRTYYHSNANKNSCQGDINALPWLIRIELDREEMLDKEVTLLDVKSKFCNAWERRFSDKNVKGNEKYIYETIPSIAMLSNTDNDKQPVIHIRFDMVKYSMTIINAFIDEIIDEFRLKGMPSITEISTIDQEPCVSFDNLDHEVKRNQHYVIYTQGVNLIDIRYINCINVYTTICNDVIAIYKTFGIEAARASLLREIKTAYTLAGQTVNYHHLSLLVDLMTRDGILISVDRHGMNKSDVDPFSRASFEKTVEQLINAAYYGETDNMKSVSSRIMAGLVIKGGTGLPDLLLDLDMLEKSEFIEDLSQKYNKTAKPVTMSNVIEHIAKETDAGVFIPDE